jgi:hypothetical protein
MPNPEVINAADLDRWSESLESRSTLPRLVRRLLLANRHVREVQMRAGEGVGVHGWDGIVTGSPGDAHIPEGFSGWELGTSGNPDGKAQSDYRDRKRVVPEAERLTTTFVAVTSRRWDKRDEWRKRKLKEGVWADVRAYDADTLETWLEVTPSVHIWISEVLGREPRHARTPDFLLGTWSRQTQPALTGPFLLAGRQDFAVSLLEALRQPAQITTVIASSTDEAIVFACAALLQDEEQNRLEIARTLVVDEPVTWGRLVDSESPLILIPTFPEADASSAMANGHHVVTSVARQLESASSVISVPELDLLAAVDVLVGEGVLRPEAEAVVTAARRSLQAARRTYAVNPNWRTPGWATQPQATSLAPLLLLGQWDAANEGDREVVAALARRTYEELEPELMAWSALEDPPVRRLGTAWHVTSRRDAWDLLHGFLAATALGTFRERAVEVLSFAEETPHSIAAMLVPTRFSRSIREGVAETCAFLAGVAPGHEFADGTTGANCAGIVVRTVLQEIGGESGATWVSIADVLPLLAEAAPDLFLEKVESDLSSEEPQLRAVFPEENALTGFFAGRSPYVGVVWALEAICWSGEHVGRAARALARLDIVDPGGRNGPRPFEALHGALDLFHPQTSVALNRRLAILDALREVLPGQGWKLLKAMLPSALGISHTPYRPWWRRSWTQPAPIQPAYEEVVAGVRSLIDRLIEDAGTDLERWAEVVPHLEYLQTEERDRVIAALEQIAPPEELTE